MNRRKFLEALGIVGGVALAEAVIPFNRGWSFPKDIRLVHPDIRNRRFVILTQEMSVAEARRRWPQVRMRIIIAPDCSLPVKCAVIPS